MDAKQTGLRKEQPNYCYLHLHSGWGEVGCIRATTVNFDVLFGPNVAEQVLWNYVNFWIGWGRRALDGSKEFNHFKTGTGN